MHSLARLLDAGSGLGCPNCPAARDVRLAVFDAAFWPDLGVLLLPLALVTLIAAGLHRWL